MQVFVRHALTIDVEDWFHGIPVDAQCKREAERRLELGMDLLLELLDAAGVRATFFLLGPVVLEHPSVVLRIADAGHELACHGWSHDLVNQMTPARFREETTRCVTAIGDLTGQRVGGYRAAFFSVTKASLWALEVLAELGFRYDSSIFPIHNWRYGFPGFDARPQEIKTAAGSIIEIPISVRRVLGYAMPVSGGAYFRLYPYRLTQSNFREAESRSQSVVFYLHLWELDPEHPRIRFHWLARATHYVNLETTKEKLERLLDDFRFGPLEDLEVFRSTSQPFA